MTNVNELLTVTTHRKHAKAAALAFGILVMGACGQTPSPTPTASIELGTANDDHCPRQRTPPATPSADLMATVDRLVAASGTDETAEGALPGYVGVIQCPDTNEIFVFWKGELPTRVTKAVADVDDIKVTVMKDAPYSATELQRASDKIWADRPHWETQDIHIQSTGPRQDGEWLAVGVIDEADELASIEARLSERYPQITIKVEHAEPIGDL